MTLLTGSHRAGPCATCRHANQGTVDFAEGHLFCEIDKQPKRRDQTCDVVRNLPLALPFDPEALRPYYLYERFDGENGTYTQLQDIALVAEDASPELQAWARKEVDTGRHESDDP